MEIDDRPAEIPRRATFWFRVLQVRLRFFAFVACLAGLFTLWPWLSAYWDSKLANWTGDRHEVAVNGASEFFCPMDPGVVSAWPAICPICNMDLIRRQKTDAVLLPEGVVARMQLSPYKLALAGIRTVAVTTESVPKTAIVYRDEQPLVYVESMPGMFDAVPIANLKPGQRVAVMGTLLLDAESRLNPNLSTQYFGAAQPSLAAAPSALPIPKSTAVSTSEGAPKQPPLSAEDQLIVNQQKKCPVTKADLGSMGTPVFVEVKNRRVALCCAGCRGRLVADPDKYLKGLDQE